MSTLKVNTIQNTSGGSSSTPEQIEQGRAKVWVNFNGTTVTSATDMTGVNDSFNVSSVVDNGTGQYTINFSSAMANANYAVVLGGPTDGGNGNLGPFANSRTTSSITCFNYSQAGNFQDISSYNAAVFGD